VTRVEAIERCGPAWSGWAFVRVALPAAALVVAVGTSQASGSGPIFRASFLGFDAGASPRSIAIGDLNGDGIADLAAVSQYSSTVAVLLGKGDGTYREEREYPAGNGQSFAVATADVNGDGKPDLIITHSNPSTVSILLGNGDGSFGASADIGVGGTVVEDDAASIVIADLNGDGKLDLAVPNESLDAVSVLLGNGDGTFGAKADFAAGSRPVFVSVGDLNGDGKLDLAVADWSDGPGGLSVLLGNGDGTFGPPTKYFTPPRSATVAIGDLNGDGKPDLAVASGNDATVSVMLGRGDGTFGDPRPLAVGSLPSCVVIGDVNADGKLDVVVAGTGPGLVSVLLGNGDGTFGPARDFPAGPWPRCVAIGDLDGDGKLDLAVASGMAAVLLGGGDGAFGSTNDFTAGSNPVAVAIADLNGDEKPDLAVANCGWYPAPGTISVWLGVGKGAFAADGDYPAPICPQALAIADLNRDGKADLVTANEGGSVSVRLGNGDGTFGAGADIPTGGCPRSVAVGDLNGDGVPDLAFTNHCSYTVSVMLGVGDGKFGPRSDYSQPGPPNSVAIGDLNADDKPDLAVAIHGASVLFGNGDGTFRAAGDYGPAFGPQSVAIADLNGDGRPDLVVANSNNNQSEVSALLGNGDGTFGTESDYDLGPWGGSTGSPISVAIADLDGDGILDLAVGVPDSHGVAVLLGNGDGSFGGKISTGCGAGRTRSRSGI